MKVSFARRAFPLRLSIETRPAVAAGPINPSFSVTREEAKRDLARIVADPRPLARPLLIIGGFLDPFVGALRMRARLRSLTLDRRVIAAALGDCLSIEGCRRRVIRAVDRRFPSDDTAQTEEVDVIGFSLGGLVARYAALPGERSLRVARLFTISSPHLGARRAERLPLLHPIQKHLRSGSDLFASVNGSPTSYPIVSYVRLGDRPVGVRNAAVPGTTPWWVTGPRFGNAHNFAHQDPRILADIMRRLRSEPPFSTVPPAPLPVEE